jgi:thiamine-monophosphate kinase
MKKNRAGLTVADLGEDALIRRITAGLVQTAEVIVGPGDDCAVIRGSSRGRHLLLKTDAIVEGVHFLPAARPELVGRKAVARVVSDIAAMGGVPRAAVITLALPPTCKVSWVEKLYAGMDKLARLYDFSLVGGETTRSPGKNAPVLINVAMTGEVEPKRLVPRSGAKVGDALFVTGSLGGSLAGRHLSFTPRLPEARWLTEFFTPRAMMDLSDGLAQDLPRLASASGVGYEIDLTQVPRQRGCTVEQALSDGEDYELLFALPARQQEALIMAWKKAFPRVRLSLIGQVREAGVSTPLAGGYEHFRSR